MQLFPAFWMLGATSSLREDFVVRSISVGDVENDQEAAAQDLLLRTAVGETLCAEPA